MGGKVLPLLTVALAVIAVLLLVAGCSGSSGPAAGRIAFQSDRDESSVYVINADGTGLAHVSNHPAADVGFPAWAPAAAVRGR